MPELFPASKSIEHKKSVLPHEEHESVAIMGYITLIQSNIISILALTIAMSILSIIIVSTMAPVYEATAKLLIDFKAKQFFPVQDYFGKPNLSREAFNTQLEILHSRDLLLKVVERLDTGAKAKPAAPQSKPNKPFWQEYAPDIITDLWQLLTHTPKIEESHEIAAIRAENNKINGIRQALNITPVRGSQIVKISFASSNPKFAAKVPNILAQIYIESGQASRQQLSSEASTWLANRLVDLKNKLQESERALSSYQEQEKLPDADGSQNFYSKQSETLSENLLVANNELIKASNLYKQVKSAKGNSINSLLSIPAVVENPLVHSAKQEETERKRDVLSLETRYGPLHPKMINAVEKLKNARKSLYQQVSFAVKAIENNYKIAQANASSIKKKFDDNRSQLKGINKTINKGQFKLKELKREVEANQQLYDVFLTRFKETNVVKESKQEGASDISIRVIDPAIIPLTPSKPNKKRIVLLVTAATFIFSILLVFFIDFMDNTIRSAEDIEKKLLIPVLGVVPLVKDKRWRKSDMALGRLFLEKHNYHFSEAIRTIYTAIKLSEVKQPVKIIAVTSTAPKEGKSTVAINLALAMSGMENILLVDGDLRRPTIHKIMDLGDDALGLSNLVSKTAQPTECFYKVEGFKLTVLPAGSIPPNPLEVLSSDRFKRLLKELSGKFDRIIIDTPPTQLVSDSLLIGSQTNATIYICQADSTPIPAISNMIKRLRHSSIPLLGVVMNKVSAKSKRGYYYSRYGSYSSYGPYQQYGKY